MGGKINILLDSDGVLVDFVTGALLVHKSPETHDDIKTWNFYEQWGATAKEFWAPMYGAEFWENLEPYPWTVEFYKELKQLGDVTVCTSPNLDEQCIVGKYRWGQKHLGLKTSNFMVGEKKYLMANKNNILIDDYPVNVDKFIKAGGNALLFAQPWNMECESRYDWFGVLATIGMEKLLEEDN